MFLKGDVVLVLACIDEHKGCYLVSPEART